MKLPAFNLLSLYLTQVAFCVVFQSSSAEIQGNAQSTDVKFHGMWLVGIP